MHRPLPLRRLLASAAAVALALGLASCSDNASGSSATTSAAPDPDPDAIAFVGVNVVPMDSERVLENHTVVVQDGRISSVTADDSQVPEGARRIDGEGRWLMPGLAEMHGHVPGPDDPDYAADMLALYVANGVTTVRNMAGHAYHLELRDRIASGGLLGPTLHAASPWLTPETAATPEAARQAVHDYQAQGFDLLKLGTIDAASYAAMAETAHAVDMPFGGHIPAEVGLVAALEARQASIDHYDRYVEFLVPDDADTAGRDPGFFGSGWVHLVDRGRIPEAIERTLAAGTWNVPTLSLVEHLASGEPAEEMIAWPEMRYMPQQVRDHWLRAKQQFQQRDDFQPDAARALVELRQQLTRELHAAGAPIALGSDAPQFFNVPGFSIHHELRMMVAAGLSPYEALATGTREPARYFGTPDAFGTVAPGRRADLILVDANPLDDVANVQRRAGVMVRGQWLPEADIQARLAGIAARNQP